MLGLLAFGATLALSLPAAGGLWFMTLAAGLWLTLRAEPLLWTPDEPSPVYLHQARRRQDLRVPPGNRLEALSGSRSGQFSIRINDQ